MQSRFAAVTSVTCGLRLRDCVFVLLRAFISGFPLLRHAPRSKRCFPSTRIIDEGLFSPQSYGEIVELKPGYIFIILPPHFFLFARAEQTVPIWAVVPPVYAPGGEKNVTSEYADVAQQTPWMGGINTLLIYLYLLLIKFWVNGAHLCAISIFPLSSAQG